jgi:hypothetical protein
LDGRPIDEIMELSFVEPLRYSDFALELCEVELKPELGLVLWLVRWSPLY